MRSIESPFTSIYPHINLHGEDRVSSVIKVKSFIDDAIILKESVVIVIHGKGTSALKNEIHDYLKKDKRIESYHLDPDNIGQTIIKIKNII